MNQDTSQTLGIVMGRPDERGAAISELRSDRRQLEDAMREGFASVNARIDNLDARMNARMDRMFFGMMSIGVAIVAMLITLIIRLS